EIYGFNWGNLETRDQTSFGNILSKSVNQVCVCPQGQLLTASRDGALRFWSVNAKTVNATAIAGGNWVAATSASMHPAGNQVVAGYGDGELRLWQFSEPAERIFVSRGKIQNAAFVGDRP